MVVWLEGFKLCLQWPDLIVFLSWSLLDESGSTFAESKQSETSFFAYNIIWMPKSVPLCVSLCTSCVYILPWPKKKKMATTIMHKIRKLFLSRNITKLARWCGLPRLRPSLNRSAIKLDFSISHDRSSVLILCIIVVAVFFFLARVVHALENWFFFRGKIW